MKPMLYQNRDLVIIEPCEGRLKKHDVALYRFRNEYILHRVIKVRDNDYVFRGDNNCFTESGVTDKDVLGVLSGFVRKGKHHNTADPSYKLYVAVWCFLYPARALFKHTKKLLRKLLKRDTDNKAESKR